MRSAESLKQGLGGTSGHKTTRTLSGDSRKGRQLLIRRSDVLAFAFTCSRRHLPPFWKVLGFLIMASG